MELLEKGLKSVIVKTTMFYFIVELGFLMMAIIVGYEAHQPLLHGASNQIPSFHHSSPFGFHVVVIYPL
jgi:hypothetical protein